MIKNILWGVAIIFLFACLYFSYDWYISEPNNKEPLPVILSIIATLIFSIIAWLFPNGEKNNNVKVASVDGKSTIDIDVKTETNVDISKIKGESKVNIKTH